jgi:hypothetical protein
MNKSKIEHYGLRFYVRDFYIKHAGKNGGEVFKPNYKKDIKPFQLRVKCAINRSGQVLSILSERNPITNN